MVREATEDPTGLPTALPLSDVTGDPTGQPSPLPSSIPSGAPALQPTGAGGGVPSRPGLPPEERERLRPTRPPVPLDRPPVLTLRPTLPIPPFDIQPSKPPKSPRKKGRTKSPSDKKGKPGKRPKSPDRDEKEPRPESPDEDQKGPTREPRRPYRKGGGKRPKRRPSRRPFSKATTPPSLVPMCPTTAPTTDTGSFICGMAVGDSETMILSAFDRTLLGSVIFASYGNPTGFCGAFEKGRCNFDGTVQIINRLCEGKVMCIISLRDVFPKINDVNRRECGEIEFSRLYVQLALVKR
eukprot:CAMPEP_0182425406 /NCGR_PEP_ID=MMETSP1167-20130531/11840_1 /TAXON_ID=2988 /ORGANISM="Mallomonas Sp, Strain CCMP3275" /LENGTH=295 /DNA_ID=CAMNT_0024606115 /DNA_START=419 /DNA_END=1306 /DNA_ORIENTATION=-